MQQLTDCSALEVGEYVAVPYAGKLLAGLGATVTKIEPPGGDVARHVGPFYDDDPNGEQSQFFGYLNTGKQSVVLPPGDRVSADAICDLIEEREVDLVIEDDLASYRLDPAELRERCDVSVVSVSGFGLTGPFQEYNGPEIVAWAESGQMNKTGYPDSSPSRPRIQATSYWTGQLAAAAGVSAVFETIATGASPQHVDLAKREVGTASHERFITAYSWSGATTQRTGSGYPEQGPQPGRRTIYETTDGHLSLAIGNRWETFCKAFIDRPELIDDERFETRTARIQHSDQVNEIVQAYLADQKKWDMFERLQSHGIPSAVTSTPKDVAEFEHLRERGFWEEVSLSSDETVTMPAVPTLYDGERPDQRRAPRLGEHNGDLAALGYEHPLSGGDDRDDDRFDPPSRRTESGVEGGDGSDGSDRPLPLEGIKVLDFTWVYAGPHASRLLGALGADVVKVESENSPDGVRPRYGFEYDSSPTSNTSAYYNEMNQGKRDITLNLNTERGRELAFELVEEADVVMESYSPTFASRVGLEYETLKEHNPEIIYLSMPGWGRSGPAKGYRAYGLVIQSMAGLDWLSGAPEEPPTTPGMSWPDPTNSYNAVFSVLAALYHRERTGEGTYVESPLFEVATSLLHKPLAEYMNNDRLAERVGNRDEDRRFVQGAYPCEGEDRWVVVAVETDAEWRGLCEAMDRSDLVDDARFASQQARFEHHDELDEIVAAWTKARSREEVRALLQARGVSAGIVADERDLVEYDPQMRVREYFAEHDHPEVGEQTYQGFPFKSSRHDLQYRSRSPLFGEHTEEVLGEWLNMSDREIDAEDDDALY